MDNRWLLAIAIVSTLTTTAASEQTLIVPAAANVDGVNQTRWRTDLQVMAVGDAGATFTVELLRTGRDNSQPLAVERSVAANGSLRLANLLDTEFGVTGTGALRVRTAAGEIMILSRTFNDDPAGTYGQTVPGVAEAAAVGPGGRANLIQLSRSADPAAGFRTNIGFVSTVGRPMDVTVDLFDAVGSPLGTVRRSLRPFEHRQINDVFHTVGADSVDDGYAVLHTTTEGGRFVCYASVVDNGTGDAVYIAGATGSELALTAQRLVVFESFMRPG